jgi:serine-type D-Ala-D-Ala carboxypeptidase/endopeptidase
MTVGHAGLVALGAMALAVSAPAFPTDAEIQALLQERLVPGTATVIGLIEGGRTRIIPAVKVGAGGPTAADGDTIFEIGSITKVFTASVLADMVEKGEVSLDDPVAKYLPPTVRMPNRGGKEITLLDLATQTSGLPRLPSNLAPKDGANPYADYTVQNLYDFLSGYALTRDIGAQYEYSNLGVGLLGHLLALRAKTDYETLVTTRILKPLGMNDTHIVLPSASRARLTPGHDRAGTPVANWDLPTLAGAGALRSTVNDMLRFAAANLEETGPLAKAFKSSHTVRRPTTLAETSIGLAWHVRRTSEGEIVWHNGGTGGYHSFLGLDQKAKTAVVMLHSSANAHDDLGFHLLDPRFPLAPVPTLPKPRKAVTLSTPILDAYVGDYELAATFSIAVTREGNGLVIQATGQSKFPIFAESETEFFLTAVDAQITFVRDGSGKVTGLVLHQNGRDTPGRRK